MKTTIFLAVLGFALAGCASTTAPDNSAATFEDTYTPTGSHIARKTVERNNGVQIVSKEDLQRSLDSARAAVDPSRQ